LTNANFLSFLCMEFSISTKFVDIAPNDIGGLSEVYRPRSFHIWEFVRYQNHELSKAREGSLRRYEKLAAPIRDALRNGSSYPWQDLVRLAAETLFSDIIQSTFGAIFADCKGDLTQCTTFAKRIGIFLYLERMAQNGTDLRHPKLQLNELSSGGKIVYSHNKDDSDGFGWCSVSLNDKELARTYEECSKECKEIIVAEQSVRDWRIASA
jgi:hypothetical protein